MQFVLKTALSITILAMLSSCSKLQFPWAYKIYVQQGNYLEQDMIEQLEVGMTPEQVRYVMGSPLVSDTFHPDRWDYYFEYKRGDRVFKEYHFTVFFENGTLASWEGDYQTTAAKEKEQKENIDEAAEKVEKAVEKKKPQNGKDAGEEPNEGLSEDKVNSAEA
ncbi:Beta-barrel assembly machine subunit BamE [Alteromonadaceae bacterium 2753L.S.0a.02]|nr:Beta-barrel assembly machine subunit BamE [Alteromonadaceae bacterium 2753L.S.0a.02]